MARSIWQSAHRTNGQRENLTQALTGGILVFIVRDVTVTDVGLVLGRVGVAVEHRDRQRHPGEVGGVSLCGENGVACGFGGERQQRVRQIRAAGGRALEPSQLIPLAPALLNPSLQLPLAFSTIRQVIDALNGALSYSLEDQRLDLRV